MSEQKFESLIKEIEKTLGNPYTEYEDKAIFVDFQVLKLNDPLRSQILDYFIDLLPIAKTYDSPKVSDDTQFQFPLLKEWAMIVLGNAKYAKAIPAIIECFEEYEAGGWDGGWSTRSALFSALMKIGGDDALAFIMQKKENETVGYLKSSLQQYIDKHKT